MSYISPSEPQRIREMFYFFARILPIYNQERQNAIEKSLGVNFKEFVPQLFDQIAREITKSVTKNGVTEYPNLEKFDMCMDFIQQGLLYIRKETNDLPDMQIDYGNNHIINSK